MLPPEDEFKDFAVHELSAFWTLFILVVLSCLVGTAFFMLAVWWRWVL